MTGMWSPRPMKISDDDAAGEEPDPANVQEPLIGAFKPVEPLLGRNVGSLR